MPPGDRLPAHRAADAPAVRQQPVAAAGAPPVYAAGSLGFGPREATREEYWERLGDRAKERVNARIGRLVEWWAERESLGISAVVLGTHALVVVKPLPDANKHLIRSIPLRAESFRSVRITEHMNARNQSPPGPGSRSGPGDHLADRLGSDMTGFLGHLPVQAQQMLQEPFLNLQSSDDLWSRHMYYKFGSERDLGGATLHAWCYLANRHYVTFAAGVGSGYYRWTEPASWDLTCWRADVDRACGLAGR